MPELEDAINSLLGAASTSTLRLQALADYIIDLLALHGLPNAAGGSRTRELKVEGLSRTKDWDVAYEHAGKFRLLISLKSMLKNIAGSVPNRLDDLMGELANVQQLRPEIVIGYVILFDVAEDRPRTGGGRWSDYFEEALKKLAIRRAPIWNQGLMEGLWFIRFDSRRPAGSRLVDPVKTATERDAFVVPLLRELRLREPAVPFTAPVPPPQGVEQNEP